LILELNDKPINFSVHGISKDSFISNGIFHLKKFGPFDEISTGNGWNNSGILKYVYGDIPGKAATPQILVVKRTYNIVSFNNEKPNFAGIKNESQITRKIGLDEIYDWISNDVLLPFDI
jgi:hypothetical protein